MEGTRVRLRPMIKSDIEKLMAQGLDEETQKLYQTSFPPPPPSQFIEKHYLEERPDAKKSYEWVIETIAGNQCIGECGYMEVNWVNSVARVAIYIGKNWWSKGLGREAMGLLMDYIFKQMNIQKIKLTVFSYNTRAIQCYEKCGFILEGRLRNEVYQDGSYHDLLCMGILKEEWLARAKSSTPPDATQ